MKKIPHKTTRMQEVETLFNLPLEELLRKMYVDENKTPQVICQELNIAYATLLKWLHLAGIYSRRLKL